MQNTWVHSSISIYIWVEKKEVLYWDAFFAKWKWNNPFWQAWDTKLGWLLKQHLPVAGETKKPCIQMHDLPSISFFLRQHCSRERGRRSKGISHAIEEGKLPWLWHPDWCNMVRWSWVGEHVSNFATKKRFEKDEKHQDNEALNGLWLDCSWIWESEWFQNNTTVSITVTSFSALTGLLL